jgi:hypothetical protein
MRLILISFGFMVWAFYVLSGGADFDPDAVRAARMAELDLEAPKPAVAPARTEPVTAAPKDVVDTDPPLRETTTRVSLNLTTLKDASDNAADAPTQTDIAAAVDAAIQEVPQNVPVVTSSADTPAIIPSLIAPNDGAGQTAENPSTIRGFDDIRTVSGNRVNVRGGPGTDFGVVGRLTRGDEVVVLEDNGAGWIRFETQDGETSGWMADFLLTSG